MRTKRLIRFILEPDFNLVDLFLMALIGWRMPENPLSACLMVVIWAVFIYGKARVKKVSF